MKYIYIPKGINLYNTNEFGNRFFGLISGSISILINRLIPIENDKGNF